MANNYKITFSSSNKTAVLEETYVTVVGQFENLKKISFSDIESKVKGSVSKEVSVTLSKSRQFNN